MEGRDRSLSANNVHFWLRKIFLYVWLSKDEGPIDIVKEIEKLDDKLDVKRNQQGEIIDGEPEVVLRLRLKNDGFLGNRLPEMITRDEALEACDMIFNLLREPFEPEIQEKIIDPYCVGGKVKRRS